jgi:hypothetical protein
MKRLFLPLTLLLSCAIAQSADKKIPLKHQNPSDDATAKVTVSLKTEQRPPLAILFDMKPHLVHDVIERFVYLKRMNLNGQQTPAIDEQTVANTIKNMHQLGADLEVRNEQGQTALDITIQYGLPEITTALVQCGANVVPLFSGHTFIKDGVKNLGAFSALITTVSGLPAERHKIIAEKAEQYNKEKKEKEKVELRKQQGEHKQSSNPIVVGMVENEKNSVMNNLFDKYDDYDSKKAEKDSTSSSVPSSTPTPLPLTSVVQAALQEQHVKTTASQMALGCY